MEIEEFNDHEILMKFFCRGLYYELEVNDLPECLIQQVIEERSVDTSELSLAQKMFLEKVSDYILTAGPLELLKLEEIIDGNTTHIGHTR